MDEIDELLSDLAFVALRGQDITLSGADAGLLHTALTTARANAIEEVAAWYADKGFLMLEDAVPDAIRALAGGKE